MMQAAAHLEPTQPPLHADVGLAIALGKTNKNPKKLATKISKLERPSEEKSGIQAIAFGVSYLCKGTPKRELMAQVAPHVEDTEAGRHLLRVEFYQRVGGVTPLEAVQLLWEKDPAHTVAAAYAAVLLASTKEEAKTIALKVGGLPSTLYALTEALVEVGGH